MSDDDDDELYIDEMSAAEEYRLAMERQYQRMIADQPDVEDLPGIKSIIPSMF